MNSLNVHIIDAGIALVLVDSRFTDGAVLAEELLAMLEGLATTPHISGVVLSSLRGDAPWLGGLEQGDSAARAKLVAFLKAGSVQSAAILNAAASEECMEVAKACQVRIARSELPSLSSLSSQAISPAQALQLGIVDAVAEGCMIVRTALKAMETSRSHALVAAG